MGALEFAITWAAEAHDGQRDRAAMPYISHICAVIAGVDTIEEKIVAALHDIVEDTDVNLQMLGNEFSHLVVEAVDAITKRDKEPYKEYLVRVKANELARKVKIADLRHNMALTRLPKITEKDEARYEKYLEAMRFLHEPQLEGSPADE